MRLPSVTMEFFGKPSLVIGLAAPSFGGDEGDRKKNPASTATAHRIAPHFPQWLPTCAIAPELAAAAIVAEEAARAAVVLADPEAPAIFAAGASDTPFTLPAELGPESISRFNLLRSARNSAAPW